MAEETTQQELSGAVEPNGASQEPETVSKADYDKLLAQSRKWERQSKSNAEKAKAYDDLMAKSMTDAERAEAATKRAEDAEAELERYRRADERRGWVEKVGKSTGVPADVLSGMEAQSLEELQKRAESIKGYFHVGAAPVVGSDGVQPGSPEPKKSADEWLRSTIPTRIKNRY